ncbi:hypothetical protein [Streptomyces sp. bgisy130]|uniref:hypothetical protein n=1 Tax=Streptomyces sp. bgisy130 TaxID=3413788 RepID=UPI003F49F5AC
MARSEAETALTDPPSVIIGIVADIEPGLSAETVLDAVREAAPKRPACRQLAFVLRERPELLTNAEPAGPRGIERLVVALQARGARNVVRPLCGDCHQPKRLTQLNGDIRICTACESKRRKADRHCEGCGTSLTYYFRGPAGEMLCRDCLPDIPDPLLRLQEMIASADPGLDAAVARQAVEVAARGRTATMRRMAWELAEQPGLLLGDGVHRSPRLLVLVDELRKAGSELIAPPRCPQCGRIGVALRYPLDGRRLCGSCYNHAKAEPCSRCQRTLPVATRTADGRPLCRPCSKQDPSTHDQCVDCGRVRWISRHTAEGPLCDTCAKPLTAVCALCGQTRPCHLSSAGQRRCRPCSQHREACSVCRQVRRVTARTPDGPLCERCYDNSEASFKTCPDCGTVDRSWHFSLCPKCAATRQLAKILGPADQLTADMGRLMASLLAKPRATLHWLEMSAGADVLQELASGACPMTHEALDARLPSKALRHLRARLVVARLLPARDENLAELERWLDSTIKALTDDDDRKLIRSFATWGQLARLRRQIGRDRPVTPAQTATVRRNVRSAITLLAWLHDSGATLATCTQAHLNDWALTGKKDWYSARTMVGWAVNAGHARRVEVPRRPRNDAVSPPLDADERWKATRRLLHDDAVDLRDRVAGLLLLLYAQPMTAIVRLNTDHLVVTADATNLVLAELPLHLPDPLDSLVNQLASQSTPLRDGPAWLFPGALAGRHMSSTTLGVRLRNLGIGPRRGRNAALLDLCAQLPSAVIARLLGMSPGTADRWAGAGRRGSYAAAVSRRT